MDQSLDAMRATLNLIPAYTWYAAPSGALQFVNIRSADYLGLPKEHPLRFGAATSGEWDSHIAFLHQDDHDETRRVWSTCLRTGEAGEVSFRIRNAHGEYRWFHSRAEPRRGSDDTLLCWIGINVDIEERKRAEQELRDIVDTIRRSEAYLAEAQKLSHTGSFGWRPDSGEIVWSEETYRIFEYDSALTPTVDSVVQRVHPSDRALVQQAIDRPTQTGTEIEHEYRLLLTDGRVKHVHAIAHAIQNASGNREFIGAVTDITERKTAEDKIQRLVESDLLGVFIANVEGEITEANKAFLQMLQYDRQDLVSGRLRWRDLTPVELRERDERTLTEALANGSFQPYETEFLRNDGSRLPVLIGGALFQSAKDGVVFVLDLSEQKRATETIRAQEAELRQMLDYAPQIIVLVGPRRERLYANRFALAYLGVSLEEWRTSSFLTEVHPDDVDRVKALVDRSAAHPADYEWDLRLRKSDGTYRWFLVRYNPLRDDQGQLIRWYLACTDIDDRRRAEERLQQENVALREEIDKASMFEEIVGGSPALTAVLSQVSKVAGSDSTVLISGETGTGKELVARAIHRRSRRASRAFVAVNCAAIPRDLIASELFGHEKGAFTGALQRRLGRFELADGGTIFLDEVGELAPDTQVALLRVLQEREFERVGGGQHPIRVDVRVIAATNRDLAQAVADGTFRQDLFYRLNVFPLEIPPLRERQDDIAVLVEYFINRYARKAGKTIRRVSKQTLARLKSYPWPGNVRELQNVIERSVIVSDTDEFTVDGSWLPGAAGGESRLGLFDAMSRHEKEIVEGALRATDGRVAGPSGAAARLGIPRSTLESKIRTLKINKSRFRA